MICIILGRQPVVMIDLFGLSSVWIATELKLLAMTLVLSIYES